MSEGIELAQQQASWILAGRTRQVLGWRVDQPAGNIRLGVDQPLIRAVGNRVRGNQSGVGP